MKDGFIRTLREAAKHAKVISLILESRTRRSPGVDDFIADREEIKRLETNKDLWENCIRLEKRVEELEAKVERLRSSRPSASSVLPDRDDPIV